MKLLMDERVKHRLIGLAVILSIGAIFAPAIMKKSNQRIDGNVNLSVELPPKPARPEVVVTEKKAMFEQAKVAHVELPDLSDEQALPNDKKIGSADFESSAQKEEFDSSMQRTQLAEEELTKGLTESVAENNIPQQLAAIQKVAKAEAISFNPPRTKVIAKNTKTPKVVLKPKLPSASKPITKPIAKNRVNHPLKESFAVQLATFSQRHNADILISRLREKGFRASFTKVNTSQGAVYKVLVGQATKREQAQILQKQLASALQMKGFVVALNQG